MLLNELIEKTEISFNQEEYNLINFVYTWHPSISDIKGKDEIAAIFNTFGRDKGLRIIADMTKSAFSQKTYEDAIAEKNKEIKIINDKKETLLSSATELKITYP